MGFGLVVLACVALVAARSSPNPSDDTDTRVLLTKLQERGNPWSWFAGDWPLENHFYRPISTLTFEMDRALYGNLAPWKEFGLNPKTTLKLDFRDANIDMVLVLYSESSGIKFVKDPNLTGDITVTSNGPVNLNSAFELLSATLGMKGYEMRKEDSLLLIRQSRAWGYGLTNALLCALSVLSLFWFLREITDKPYLATFGALLFALWHFPAGLMVSAVVTWASWAALLCILFPGRRPIAALSAFAATWFLSSELPGLYPLDLRMMQWLPGRTASTMTLFALLAMASYARFERTSATILRTKEITPLDPPATKGTALRERSSKASLSWPVVAVLCSCLALGSYEQAVMLPAALLGVGLTLKWQGYRVRWGWHAAFWGLLGGYFALRYQMLAVQASGYQMQQFRNGPGVIFALGDYILPAGIPVWNTLRAAEGALLVVLFSPQLSQFMNLFSNVWTFVLARRQWVLPLAGYALTIVTFLPMAWLKHFDHYHYWPMAMRTLLVAGLMPVVGAAWVSAMSRPALQAPPRPDPAPGSLPRP